MNITNSWVCNFDQTKIKVKYLVLHYTCFDLHQTLNFFNQKISKASSHFVINSDGIIYQCVDTEKRAWHCGISFYQGDQNLNDFAIGVELVNQNGNFFHYTKEQYVALVCLTKELIKKYPILNHPENIIGHEQISTTRGKIDPGFCFDWLSYLKILFPKLDYCEIKKFAANRCKLDNQLLKAYQVLFTQNQTLLPLNKNQFWASFNHWLELSQKKQLITR